MTIFISSDSHFFHSNIISFCKRPYKSIEEMNHALVQNWNSKVQIDDIVYFLGDFALGKFTDEEIKNIFDSLNGNKILIVGNHDHSNVRKLNWVSQHEAPLIIKDNGFRIVLFHYPMRDWNGKFQGSYHLFGHTHGTIPNIERSADVGVDSWNMFPVTFSEIKARLDAEQLVRDEIQREEDLKKFFGKK